MKKYIFFMEFENHFSLAVSVKSESRKKAKKELQELFVRKPDDTSFKKDIQSLQKYNEFITTTDDCVYLGQRVKANKFIFIEEYDIE